MDIVIRKSQDTDLSFLWEMLYEAVFWRAGGDKPSFEEGLAYPEVKKALADWGARDGDTAVVATLDAIPVGAAWYRYWTDDNFINGYVAETTPVVVIGVQTEHQRQGVGTRLIDWLVEYAAKHSIERLSLSVSKDNHALHLYRQQGFVECADKGDQFLMVREILRHQVAPASL